MRVPYLFCNRKENKYFISVRSLVSYLRSQESQRNRINFRNQIIFRNYERFLSQWASVKRLSGKNTHESHLSRSAIFARCSASWLSRSKAAALSSASSRAAIALALSSLSSKDLLSNSVLCADTSCTLNTFDVTSLRFFIRYFALSARANRLTRYYSPTFAYSCTNGIGRFVHAIRYTQRALPVLSQERETNTSTTHRRMYDR